MAWLLRDGEVLATLEVADDRPGPHAAGLLGRDGIDGALLLQPGPLGAHVRHALRRSTSPSATATYGCSGS